MEGYLITALAALFGGALGSWITAALATRRERWNLRRELYTSLLQNLGGAQDALASLFRMEQAAPPRGPEAERRWDEQENLLADVEAQAVKEIRRITWVAAIILHDEVATALHQLETDWMKGISAESKEEHLDLRIAATKKAYNLIVEAAKKDLS